MQFKVPKDDETLSWTRHVTRKMSYYGISEGLVRRVIRSPKRTEVGVASDTIAVMQPTGSAHTKEVWVMYQLIAQSAKRKAQNLEKTKKAKIRVISAWRYPGRSPVRGPLPIPVDILAELSALEIESHAIFP